MSVYPHPPRTDQDAAPIDWHARAEAAERRLAEVQRALDAERSRREEAERLTEFYRASAVRWTEFERRGDIKPAIKVLAKAIARRLGFGPGMPPQGRRSEWVTIYRADLASETGICADDVGDYLQAMVEAGWLRKKPGALHDALGRVRKRFNQYAHPEGLDWERTWGDPMNLPLIDKPAKRKAEAEKRDKEKKEGAQAGADSTAEAPATDGPPGLVCPRCGSTHLVLFCTNCETESPLPEALGGTSTVNDDSSETVPGDSGEDTPLGNDEGPDWGPDAASDGGETSVFTVKDDSSETARGAEESLPHRNLRNLSCDFSSETVDGEPPPLWDEESDYGPADDGDALPDPLPTAQEALAGAGARIAPAVIRWPHHLEMTGKADPKYLTRPGPMTADLIVDHLVGKQVYGTGLFWEDTGRASGRAGRALGWDADKPEHFSRLIRGACQLRRQGLMPLLVRNPAKEASGHLWVIFDADVDPCDALSVCEQLAPALADVPERFPHPHAADGKRLRLPGGRYLPPGKPPVDVLVALAPRWGTPAWHSGVSVEGWVTISRALTDARCLTARWVAPERRYRPRRPAAPPARPAASTPPGPGAVAGGSAFFREWCAAHPISSMVHLERRGHRTYFKAPWRDEKTASVEVFEDGHWHDYGPDARHGVDAFDLWCALNDCWDAAANKPDRKAAYRRLRGT